MGAFLVLGSLVALAGIGAVVFAIRNRRGGGDPKTNAMLIGGTMAAAFGIVIAGFSVAWQSAAPLDLNSTEAQ
jgi:drug/metabolite transporter (DMT)-like permease